MPCHPVYVVEAQNAVPRWSDLIEPIQPGVCLVVGRQVPCHPPSLIYIPTTPSRLSCTHQRLICPGSRLSIASFSPAVVLACCEHGKQQPERSRNAGQHFTRRGTSSPLYPDDICYYYLLLLTLSTCIHHSGLSQDELGTEAGDCVRLPPSHATNNVVYPDASKCLILGFF